MFIQFFIYSFFLTPFQFHVYFLSFRIDLHFLIYLDTDSALPEPGTGQNI